MWAMVLGCVAAIAVGMAAGAIIGAVVAYVGAHPIIVSLAMMIFLRGLGEFLTKGSDISGFPDFVGVIGHGTLFEIPVPLILFGLVAAAWYVLLKHTQHGFSVYMTGSNMLAAEYAGLHTKRTLVLIYTLSGLLVRGRRHPDGGTLQLGAGRTRRGAAARDGACLLPRWHRSVRRPRPRRAGHSRRCVILQVLSSGLNLIGANQHLATAIWGFFLILVMVLRSDQVKMLVGYFKRP